MSDYTPSIQELARAYEAVFVEARRPEARAEAARAIAAHDAAKRAEWEGDTEWEYEATPDWIEGIRWSGKSLEEHLSNLDRYSDPNGGWWYGEKENKPDRITYQVRHRRKAGPWLPVTNTESEGEA